VVSCPWITVARDFWTKSMKMGEKKKKKTGEAANARERHDALKGIDSF